MSISIKERWPVVSNWKFFVLVGLPVVLLPLLFIEDNDEVTIKDITRESTKFKCAYVIILMAIYWMVEAMPLAVTSFLPIVLFPLLGVQDTSAVSINYMRETNMMFVGGLIIAISVEYSNLHKRVALRVLTLVGSSPTRLMLGMMMTTMFLSMWISNTATTAMMVPIVLAVLNELHSDGEKQDAIADKKKNSLTISTIDMSGNLTNNRRRSSIRSVDGYQIPIPNGAASSVIAIPTEPSIDEQNEMYKSSETMELQHQLMIAVLYAANIGGIFWPYSSTTSNVVYRHIDREKDAIIRAILLGVAYSSNIGGTGSITGSTANLVLTGKLQLEQLLQEKRKLKRMAEKMYLFAIAYSSNIGGTGVATGSAPNLIMLDLAKQANVGQGGKYTDLTFATWMIFNIPGMIINVTIAWLYLVVVFFGVPDWMKCGKSKSRAIEDRNRESVEKLLLQKYRDLGKISFHELAVALVFVFVVALWFFRDPKFITGWSDYIKPISVGDSTAAMLAVFFLFVIPKDLNFFKGGSSETLLDWKYVQDNLPWGVVLLMGGGFALSDASINSGLSDWIGLQLNGLKHLDKRAILFIVMIMTATITEVASNTATANVLIPILISLSKNLNLHPLYLSLPAAITCSYAFMLPVATPPNAIVFGAADGRMKILDMAKTGLFLNLSCCVVLFLLQISYGELIFKYSDYVYPNSTVGGDLSLLG